ncbi:branched-chain amino acid transport system permease protein [Agrobacterium vitis]|nr:branched-chain amino acid transport system permease protein [Agrobacterium vitis]MBE1437949.1 branched-chain amino acid transport system permease protein [Agrobacterium vitis]
MTLPISSRLLSFLTVTGLGLAALLLMPLFLDGFSLLQATLFVAVAILALSQAFLWGYAGILSFGQAAFFGLGGYTYAVGMINFGDSTGAIALSIIIPAAFAALLGYFMFYGRISDAYVGVITLTVTTILYELSNSTSGDQYRIGSAQLGGFNGMPGLAPFNIPGEPDQWLDEKGTWYVAMGALLLIYVLLRGLLATWFGRVVIAIRENETRAMLVGYDVRFYKLAAFAISGAIAGLGGCIYAAWGGFVNPSVFALSMSAQAIVSVLVGGIGTLLGPILGAVIMQALINLSGTQAVINPSLGMGIILVIFVILVPQGILPSIAALLLRLKPAPQPIAAKPQEAKP